MQYSSDNLPYEKVGNNELICIAEEVPFEIPVSWEWVRLGSILKVKGGKRLPKEHNLTDVPTNHIYIRVTDMKNHTIYSDKLKYITESTYQLIKNYIINKEDLYLTIAGTIGNIGIVPDKFDGMNLTENAVKLTDIRINKYYLLHIICSNYIQNKFVDKTNKVAQPKLAIERILTTLLPLPPIEEQQRIVDKIKELEPYIKEYDVAYEKIEKLNNNFPDQLKKSILQEAVQGKLVPQNPEDEPASVLIERIREEKQKLIKEKKIKKDKNESYIFRRDNSHYEKIGSEERCIDDEIPFDIPDNWEWVRLKTITQINPRNQGDDDANAGFMPMTLLSAGYKNKHTFETRKWKQIKTGFTHFSNNDIVIAKITPCFQNRKSAIIKDLPNNIGAGTTELHVIRDITKKLCLEYLLCLFKTEDFVCKGIKAFTGTAGQQRIGKDFIEEYLIPLPPIEEQKRIVEKIQTLMPIIEIL